MSEAPDSAPVLTFLGAAGTVTGSRFLLETADARVLIDCGLFQGLKALRLRNWDPFPVDPGSIDAVVLTHAHVDHVGYLPALCRDGFTGPVFATTDTAALVSIVLPDSGHLQEEEANYANRKGYSKHHPALALYTEHDARAALGQLVGCSFGDEVEVAPGVFVTFRPAGHILGSAIVSVRLAAHDDRRVVFSGDLGRPHHPVLRSPAEVGDADLIVVESTYGNRHHDDQGALDEFAEAIRATMLRGGTVLIPAFAVDRTEVVLFHLRDLVSRNEIPDVPIFVDSPMALAALRVYEGAVDRGAADLDPALHELDDPFDHGQVIEVPDVEGSKALAEHHYPCIIVSASGMATGGRVLHHLARLLPESRNTVILVGYQAAGTRGRTLASGAKELKLLGRYVRVRAQVVDLGSFSIHADQGELLGWLRTATNPPETVFVVHGEPTAADTLRELVETELDWSCVVPRHLERVRLDTTRPAHDAVTPTPSSARPVGAAGSDGGASPAGTAVPAGAAEYVRITRPEPAVAVLTLDRADKRNALSIQLRDEMSDALDELAGDDTVSAVVIESVGPVFCAGFDLAEFDDPDIQDRLWASSDRWHETLRSFPLPLIASIQGPALAGGFDLATMCDLRIAARSASFRRPELAWGVAIYSILADLVGGAVARELSMTQRTLDAEQALDLHLVTRVVEDDQLATATLELAREVATCDRGALRHVKAMAIQVAKHAPGGTWGW